MGLDRLENFAATWLACLEVYVDISSPLVSSLGCVGGYCALCFVLGGALMSTSKMNPAYELAYHAMLKADGVFHAAVIRQFGRKNAGTMRYISSQHNPETKAAAEAYWVACADFLDRRPRW